MSFQRLPVEAMWTFVLTVSLLCLTSEALVTCKNNNGATVDWFIIYKTPTVRTKQLRLNGKEYIYMDSTGAKETTPNNKLIDDPTGILANTLRPLFRPISQMAPTFGYISYSDQPPHNRTSIRFGHSKGIVLVDRQRSGVWLMHSTPKFPYRRSINNFWPSSGAINAQTFICVTLPYSQFAAVGLHLQYIRAFPFDYHIPDDFHRQLIEAVGRKKLEPPGRFQPFTTAVNDYQFFTIAKRQSPQPNDGDLYVTIGQLIRSDVYAQTWGRQQNRSTSYCPPNLLKVSNVERIHMDMGSGFWDWKPSSDHSKWCVAKDQNKNWLCIADVNRSQSQYKRRGGALCLTDTTIKNIFSSFVGGTRAGNIPVGSVPCN